MDPFLSIATTVTCVIFRGLLKSSDTYVVNNVLDVTKLAFALGGGAREQHKNCKTITDMLDKTIEHLESSGVFSGLDDDQIEMIANQVIEDLEHADMSQDGMFARILEQEDITKLLEEKSKDARSLWSDKEQGVYHNVQRMMAEVIKGYYGNMQEFSVEAIKKIYANQEQLLNHFDELMSMVISVIQKSAGTQVDYRDYEISYLTQIERKYNKITLFGSGITDSYMRKYDVMTSFVKLNCMKTCEESEYSEGIGIENITQDSTIAWLRGEAGGGKTTFVQWMAITAAIKNKKQSDLGGLIPIVIKLRDADFPLDIENEIKKLMKNTGEDYPSGYLKYLYEYDRVLLLIDGVDEIKDEDKVTLYESIDQIYQVWEERAKKNKQEIKSKIVITSRLTVQLDLESSFETYEIQKMRMHRIKEFVHFWHKTILSGDTHKTKETIDKEIRECSDKVVKNISLSRSLKNIAGTPLLCAMICALSYHSNGIVPENRCELYDSCCKMLIDSRDKERGLDKLVEEKYKTLNLTTKTTILQKIALYMMECDKTEIARESIVDHLTSCLNNSTLIQGPVENENVDKLLDYLIARTGIIREPSKGNIDFVHKTFMEFLASLEIKSQSAYDKLENKVLSSFWKETVIDCFWNGNEKNVNRLLTNMIDKYNDTSDLSYIFMAAMCANAATSCNAELDEKIKELVSALVPPSINTISDLERCGEYILPFLENKDEYSVIERKLCCSLLERLVETEGEYSENDEEVITILLSYLEDKTSHEAVRCVIDILARLSPQKLAELDVGEKVYHAIEKHMIDDKKMNCVDTFFKVLPKNGKPFDIDELIVTINSISSYYVIIEKEVVDINTLNLFSKAKKVSIVGVSDSEDLQVLYALDNMEELELDVEFEAISVLDELKQIPAIDRVKRFVLRTRDLTYLCKTDVDILKSVEDLTLELYNKAMDLDLEIVRVLPQLKNLEIKLQPETYWGLENDIIDLKEHFSEININIDYANYEYDEV